MKVQEGASRAIGILTAGLSGKDVRPEEIFTLLKDDYGNFLEIKELIQLIFGLAGIGSALTMMIAEQVDLQPLEILQRMAELNALENN